jgi:hypothetical protein
MITSHRLRDLQNEIKVENSDIVFVGYGIVAPEYGWNDYKDVDVRGKTLLMLINDPPIPDPNDPTKLDEKMFGGRAMTYYGRWTTSTKLRPRKARLQPSLFMRPGRRRIRIRSCARVGRRRISNSTPRTRTRGRFRCVPGLR